MRLFGFGLLTGLLVVLGGLLACYAALSAFAPANVPAPAITRLDLLDEKLRFLRRRPDFDPTILAVGSSVTWRQLSGAEFHSLAPGPRHFLNGATGYLHIHQTRDLANFYLDHYRGVKTLLVMVSLPDFQGCADEPAEMLDHESAALYAFRGWPPLYFYLRYFSPVRYIRLGTTLSRRQVPFAGDFYLDEYGSGPVWLPAGTKLGLRYGEIKTDAACIEALRGFVRDTQTRGIRLVLVFTPIHPEYRTLYPASIEWLTNLAESISRDEGANPRRLIVLDYVRDPLFKSEDFFDALHLQWPAVKRLSARIAGAM